MLATHQFTETNNIQIQQCALLFKRKLQYINSITISICKMVLHILSSDNEIHFYQLYHSCEPLKQFGF